MSQPIAVRNGSRGCVVRSHGRSRSLLQPIGRNAKITRTPRHATLRRFSITGVFSFRHGVALVVSLMVVGCGQKDPTISPPVDTGSIAVSSSPDSAAIFLDRDPTGRVTPDTLWDISTGLHWINVERGGYQPMPCSLQVNVSPGVVSSAHFDLVSETGRVTLLESFTNTGCMPCAEVNPMLYRLVDDLGPQRVVLLEFHTNFPSPLDPFYLAQRALMDARMTLYGVGQVPWLVVEGTEALQPTSRDVVEEAIGETIALEKVALTLGAWLDGAALTCSVSAVAEVPGPCVLTVFVCDDHEEFETAPGNNGETDFRHVVRGVLPEACGEDVILGTDPELRVWAATLAWRSEGESITLVAHARKPGMPGTVGLAVHQLQ
ncbi:PEGA domain-containing protein [Candidatus Fermentibacteria bacterium]|nr:PEGA domain-containing protein [Candidatus Fermentibacteria bacterium]